MLDRYSIGTKLLITPLVVAVLLIIVAAAANLGIQAQQSALKTSYEVHLLRLLETTEGLNRVCSLNEAIALTLLEHRAAEDGAEAARMLDEPLQTIAHELGARIAAFEATSRNANCGEITWVRP